MTLKLTYQYKTSRRRNELVYYRKVVEVMINHWIKTELKMFKSESERYLSES